MSVFDDLVGQAAVRAQLERAAIAARDLAERTTDGEADRDSAMSQAWLITGPPGSGRSLAARAFAAALQCTGPAPGCGRCRACRTVMEGKHPDVEHVATEGVVITVDQTRDLVGRSFVSPGSGAWRVVIVEDADRMAERTTNVLLKAIEEPPPFTVWMLCTPSPEDVMTTIRSRCRGVALAVPPASDVAALLGCAVLTGGGAVMYSARLQEGESLIVVGLGGVGLAAVLAGLALGAGRVTAVDVQPAKLDAARALGAHDALTPSDAVDAGLTADVVVEAVGRASAFEQALRLTAAGGRTVTVGLPAPDDLATVSPLALVAEGRSIIGSYLGGSVPRRDIPRFVELWRSGRLPVEKLVSRHIGLGDINEAMDELAAGRAVRQVIHF